MTPPLATATLALSTSRDERTGETWVHVLPAGSFHTRDGRGPWRAEDPGAIMAMSRQLAGRSAIPIDYDHQIDRSEKNGQPAVAAGWIKGLQSRTDGIWGLVEWTARAAGHLAAREYRYLSPVITYTRDGKVTAILRAGLVNNPALDQLTALASMENPVSTPSDDDLGDLREMLSLSADAGTPAILAAVRELLTARNSAGKPNPAEYVPIGDFLRVTQELTKVHQGIDQRAAVMHVEEQIRTGKLFPFQKEWAVDLCTINKPAFDKFVADMGPKVNRLIAPSGASAIPPSLSHRAADLSDTDAHVAKVMGIAPGDLSKVESK